MSFRQPHLARQADIEQWAQTLPAQSHLPNLVRNLIADLVPEVSELAMAGDEHISLPGYDGIVTSPTRTPFVPEGRSVWEFGVNDDVRRKAESDYNKRTQDPLNVDPATATFVFVTPHRWPGANRWAEEKNALKQWKCVEVRTVADLYAALELSPRTHVKFSEDIGIPANGVQTLAQWWKNFAGDSRGLLNAEILTAGRELEASKLLTAITDEAARHLWIAAVDSDDVLSFVAAVIEKAEPTIRQDLLDKALVVFDPGALSYLGNSDGLLILVPFEESLVRHADLIGGHHVILQTSSKEFADFRLPQIPIGKAEGILKESGVEDPRSHELARAVNKSVALFKRKLTGISTSAVAIRGASSDSAIMRKMWLLGSWNFGSKGDQAVVERGAETLMAFHDALDPLLGGSVPVFTQVGSAWKVFDPKSSLAEIVSRITPNDLQFLETVVQDVLGAIDPKLDLPREERWRASIDGKGRSHSSDLRNGLAGTLALLGGSLDGTDDPVVRGQTLSGWATLVVRALLHRANEDSSGKLWESLLDVLTLLAEAAPDVFLNSVEVALKPGGAFHSGLFDDDDSEFFSPTSTHVYLQWALELLAWSPTYFSEASSLILEIAKKAPSASVSNSPVSTLVRLFLPWRPQTSASLDSRNAVLSRLARGNTSATWDLLLGLYPDRHGFVLESNGPLFHDWKTTALESKVPMMDYVAAVNHVVDLSLERVRVEPRRAVDLVEKFDDVTTDLRDRMLAVFTELGNRADLEKSVSASIWKAFDSFTRRHRQFSDSDWALDEEVLSQIGAIAEGFRPSEEEDLVEWLFDHHPDLGDVVLRDNYREYAIELHRRQVEAAEKVFAADGLSGLVDLASRVVTPWSVGTAAGASSDVRIDLDLVAPLMVDAVAGVADFARAYISRVTQADNEVLSSLAHRHVDSPLMAARILRLADDLRTVWDELPAFGTEVDRLYWSEFEIYGRGDFTLVNEAARHLGEHGRYAVALDLLAIYPRGDNVTVDAVLVADLLNTFATAGDPEAAVLSQYDIGKLLEYVETAEVADRAQLGLLQWRLLPALDGSSSIAALESLLATSPEFFVQMISLLYRRKDDDTTEVVAAEVSSNAWKLLNRWSMTPGSQEDGTVNESELITWTEESRRLLEAADRLAPGEAHIGQVLARTQSDPDDGVWPCKAVRGFLENHSTEVIDRNFNVGIFNKRGVTSRGLTDGGVQERALADRYEASATALMDDWPRVARLLRDVAEGYRRDALREDEEARRIEEGFGL